MEKLKIFLIIIILIAGSVFTPLVQLAGSPLAVKDPLKKADAVVVISGGWASKNQLGKSTLERYQYGLKLFQKNYSKYLLLSGGNLKGTPSEAEEMAEMAITDGFPNESIIIEGNSETTWENALFVKRLLLERHLNSVILVTSPYHMLRAKTMFNDLGINVIAAPVPDSEFNFSLGTENLRIAKLILLEYVKLALYKVNITR